MKEIKVRVYIDGLHILMWNRIKKSLAIAFSGMRRGSRSSGSDLTNVQYKPIWNYHNESPLYNEYILILKKGNNNNNKKTYANKE
jgi:hypothetical protein